MPNKKSAFDLYRLIISKFCIPTPNPASDPLFGNHILNISERGGYKQVCRVAAGWVIAFVTNKQPIRDISIVGYLP